MNKSISLRLAMTNIKNNRKFYLPYFLASVGIVAMFYIICFLAASPGVAAMSDSLSIIMGLGVFVMGLFSFIFLFYTNSFLMKRRKKEIGLYNILGMEKKHIGKILAIENTAVSLCSIAAGLACGILFSKLIYLFLSWAFGTKPPFGIEISPEAVLITLVLFGILFVMTMISNQMSIHLAKPIELLYGGNTGEKEPKIKWLLTMLGVVFLGAGYYIAITTESPLTALLWFFVAVVLVILGTYCLFIAGSIAVLKALKKNKKFYYKPANFTAVSGLIYRMKQNAVGLANICILSTMVLVMVSGTVSLYAGMQDIINNLIPGDVNVTVSYDRTDLDRDKIESIFEETAAENGLKISKVESWQSLSFVTEKSGTRYELSANDAENGSGTMFVVVSAAEYERITGKKLRLAKDQTAVYSEGETLPERFSLGNMSFRMKKQVDQFFLNEGEMEYMRSAFDIGIHYLVVSDDQVLQEIYQEQKAIYGDAASDIQCCFAADLTGPDQQRIDCAYRIFERVSDQGLDGSIEIESRQETAYQYRGLTGGFLFLGIFLGIVFTFAAALIIYYKQISEGYYDKDKFEIMQKVGMSKIEVKKTIRKQVLMVFFAPLIMAGIHVIAAFRMISQLLLVFGMTNVPLFALCTVVTFLVFAVIYAVVYAVTAREYYKIVG